MWDAPQGTRYVCLKQATFPTRCTRLDTQAPAQTRPKKRGSDKRPPSLLACSSRRKPRNRLLQTYLVPCDAVYSKKYRILRWEFCQGIGFDVKKICLNIQKIGVTGFEPATSRPPAVRSNQTEPYPEK